MTLEPLRPTLSFTFHLCPPVGSRSVGRSSKNLPVHQWGHRHTSAAHRRGHAHLQTQDVSRDATKTLPLKRNKIKTLIMFCLSPSRREEESYQKFIPFIGVRFESLSSWRGLRCKETPADFSDFPLTSVLVFQVVKVGLIESGVSATGERPLGTRFTN